MEEELREHVLLTFATRRPYRQVPEMPQDAHYNDVAGYWISLGVPLALRDHASGPLMTKKCDQETGEDLKGE